MFWENFYSLCRENNRKPLQVVNQLGIASGSITMWKKGTRPSEKNLRKLAEYFGVTPDYFFVDHSAPVRRGVKIPVYGNVAAGIPTEAITDIEDYEEIDEETARKGDYAALRIHGKSMEPRMCDGDVVIVRIQDDIESGETAVVLVNGQDATCKKIKKTPEGIMLVPNNPDFEPIYYTIQQISELPVRIWGKVVELRAKF